MTTYAVGDLQGCFVSLLNLLDKLNFNWDKDKLWLAGDLVNRGPQSLDTLRYLHQHRERVRVVLGNHDLHMLAIAEGVRRPGNKDNLSAITDYTHNRDLIDWLISQPLARYSKKYQTLMVHAGVAKQWSLKQTLALSDEISEVLQNKKTRRPFLSGMYGNQPDQWSDDLIGTDRHRVITNIFTRMRFCDHNGKLNLTAKSKPYRPPKGCLPWYKLPLKIKNNVRIVFGHWAALEGRLANERFQAIDTGCVWGGKLTAVNLKTGIRTSV
ncbi:MAG: symmetrical bis(5'-nucleosyl)-tetraphosphatase [Kangiellaceae bacterium]|jgi:bis(5'-nucleosyl)-tetraphosphatase (symmetrical)|nr:symmetrical bis(5'-nucleosyl)-tetraphosphatase [Kangiellaceae bacterium]